MAGAGLKGKIPVAGSGKKEYAEVEMVAVEDLFDDTFKKHGDEIIEMQDQIKELEALIAERKEACKEMMASHADAASWSARSDGWSVTYMKPSPRKTLVRELLIQNGVSLKQIEKSTVSTPSNPYVTFRKAKEQE